MSPWEPRIEMLNRRDVPETKVNEFIVYGPHLVIYSPNKDLLDHAHVLPRIKAYVGQFHGSTPYYGYIVRRRENYHLGLIQVLQRIPQLSEDEVRRDIRWFLNSDSAKNVLHAGCSFRQHLFLYEVIILPDRRLGTVESIIANGNGMKAA